MRKINKFTLSEGKQGATIKNVYKGLEILYKYDAYAYLDEQGYLCVESALLGSDTRNPDIDKMYFWSWEYISESDCWAIWIGSR